MAAYQCTASAAVIRTGDGALIPEDAANRDRAAYHEWLANGGVPDPYVAPPPVAPRSISDRQFYQQLAIEGIISEADALAANAAVIPPALLAVIDAMPTAEQFGAKMIVSGATTFERNDPLTVRIGMAQGWSAARIDAFFIAAAAL
ncbi:hypothetical protein [Bradyrhizobium sp. WD16]|uniref:hypothetical protein n=1 Tax=Bradyrhizobium sp. WD16 TaxID=1521768 RepID=UPI0020A49694|nr:hypothetical protein [Bradyrhizobium sp. WD16]UTD28231.1 hypothetical protein DB459_16350 [Bradyrhizobium sp. WD16]